MLLCIGDFWLVTRGDNWWVESSKIILASNESSTVVPELGEEWRRDRFEEVEEVLLGGGREKPTRRLHQDVIFLHLITTITKSSHYYYTTNTNTISLSSNIYTHLYIGK